MAFLLDSVILIDHFNGIAEATRFLSVHPGEISISLITRAEVLTGFEPDEIAKPKRFLEQLPIFPVTIEDADAAAGLRRQHRWKLPDALQAAIAMNHGLRLATRNSKDFPPERHPFVYVPYSLHP